MIIECINCNKKFEVDPNLIPITGRNIQCGSCDHIWFFKKEKQLEINLSETKTNQVKRTTNVEIPKLTESIIKEAEKRLTTSKETKNLEKSYLPFSTNAASMRKRPFGFVQVCLHVLDLSILL